MVDEKAKAVIALGYFDSVHLGHKSVLENAKKLANKLNAKFVVFTFKGNLRSKFNLDNGVVFTTEERMEIYKSLGADEVVFAPLSKKFLLKGGRAFLNYLNGLFCIKAYVCGKDYRFGKNAKFDVNFLKSYADKNGQSCLVCDIVYDQGEKISTTKIKELLALSEIEKVNGLLTTPYFITGKVVMGRSVGSKIGFPTANVDFDKQKSALSPGVYSGEATFLGKNYKCLINLGSRPTFDEPKCALEVHLINFKGDLYGKRIKVTFNKFLRKIKKFDSVNELIKQINADLTGVRNG